MNNRESTMSLVRVTLNGKKITADSNVTILEVARDNGIAIPTLCHDIRLEPFGSCRVCLVKVEGAKTFVPSCSTKVTEGMVIDTESPQIIEARHMSLALLISDHYGDCVSPCTLECPAHIDIQGYIALIGTGKYREAVKLIKEKNPMPVTIGRICPHPCEEVCRRDKVDEPVAINNLKRFAADYDIALTHPFLPEIEPSRGERVAVIGSGPAGLSAAYYLALMGYGVTIFEKSPGAGGMLRYGIPEYRLPKNVLDREIELILSLGIEIRHGVELGRDFSIDDLRKDGYSAAFVGIGAQKSTKLRIEGENLPEVISGLDFLFDAASGKRPDLAGKRIIVVGGGNTAMDASRTALRLGANKVSVLYRRTRKEMPAHEFEITEAEDEGIEFQFLSAPVRVTEENGMLRIECIRMELGMPDASGRQRPIPVEGSGYALEAHNLIAAIGQTIDTKCIREPDLITEKDMIRADPETGATANPFIFAGGDCVSGAATAIEAIAGGRKAALSIDAYLRTGKKPAGEAPEFNISKGRLEEIPDEYFAGYEKTTRARMPALSPDLRIEGFEEIEKGLQESAALQEAYRCLECGCIEGFNCALRKYSTLYGVAVDEYKGEKNHYEEFNNILCNHPPILRDENKCIKCGTCVRICDEVWGLSIFGYVRRGFVSEIRPYFGLPLEKTACDFCGQCADACPTGALALNTFLPKPGPFKEEKRPGICINCSLGCELEYNVYENLLLKCTGVPGGGENEGNLCVRGRFGYRYLLPPERVFHPCEFFDGKMRRIPLEASVQKAAELLGRSKKTGIFTSTSLSNEEYEKIHELAGALPGAEVFHIPCDFAEYGGGALTLGKQWFKEDLLAHLAGSRHPLIEAEKANWKLSASSRSDCPVEQTSDLQSNCSFPVVGKSKPFETAINSLQAPNLSELHRSDAIVLFNIYPGRSFPILELKVRQAAQRGTKLYVVNHSPTRLDEYADGVFRVKKSLWTDFLNLLGLLCSSLTTMPREACEYSREVALNKNVLFLAGIKEGKVLNFIRAFHGNRVIFIADEDTTPREALKAFVMLALLQGENAKLLLMQRGANPCGARRFLDGASAVEEVPLKIARAFDTLLLYKLPEIFSCESQGVLHIGFKPYASYGRYGLFIPSSSLLESGGSIYLYNGKKVRVEKVLKNAHGIDNVHTLTKVIQKISRFSSA